MRDSKKEHHKKQDKEILRKYRELSRLRKARWNLGWIELEKPIRKGFERILAPRKDYLRRKDAEYFKELAELIAPVPRVLSIDGTFLKKDYFKRTVAEEHAQPRSYEPREFRKILARFQKEFFETTETRPLFRMAPYQVRVFKLQNPWRFTEQTIPHYVTHVRICDPDLDSRIGELENYFNRNALYGKLDKLLGVKDSAWDEMDRQLQTMKEKRILQKDVSLQVLEYSLSRSGEGME